MPQPINLASYRPVWDELAARLSTAEHTIVETVAPTQAEANSFRLEFYGYRKALRRHAGPDAPGLKACMETKVTINFESGAFTIRFERNPETESMKTLRAKLAILNAVELEPNELRKVEPLPDAYELYLNRKPPNEDPSTS